MVKYWSIVTDIINGQVATPDANLQTPIICLHSALKETIDNRFSIFVLE